MKKILYISLLLVIQNVSYALTSTKDSRENDALTCSGLFYILTAIPEPKELNDIFAGHGELMKLIYGQLNFIRTNDSLNNGEIARGKALESLRLGELHDKNSEEAGAEYIQCNAWRADIAEQFKEAKSRQDFEQIIKNPPVAPMLNTIKTTEDRKKAHVYQLDTAMKAWSEAGRFTYMDIKGILEGALEKRRVNPKK